VWLVGRNWDRLSRLLKKYYTSPFHLVVYVRLLVGVLVLRGLLVFEVVCF